MVTLGEVAARLNLGLGDADPKQVFARIAPLDRAEEQDLSFLTDRRYLGALQVTRAACVITRAEWAQGSPVPVLCTADPYLAYARVSSLFERQPPRPLGIHATAIVDPTAMVAESASIGAHVCIEANAQIGEHAVIAPGVFIGSGVRLGARTRIEANVTLYHGVSLGDDCQVHSATVIGSDGFGFARTGSGWEKIAQLGTVRIGHRVNIGASVAIDRGALDDTVIGDDVIIDNQVHIAHNCVIGPRTAIAGCVGFAGSTTIGADCTFAGQVGISGHLEICDNVHFTGQARVTRSISEPGTYASGTPLETSRQWGRNAVRFGQLDAMYRRLAALEAAVLEAADGKDGSGAND